VPAVDLHRELSQVSVQANGGNVEVYQINLPRDRILVGLAGAEISIPAGLEWPSDGALGNFQAEIFKVRDRNDVVVGVGTRMASSTDASGSFIEWTVHLPARGTIYAQMEMEPAADGHRNGVLRSGTRDFEVLHGTVQERFVADVESTDQEIESRIQLITTLVGPLQVDENDDLVDVVANTEAANP
jgi:hypothetical protein